MKHKYTMVSNFTFECASCSYKWTAKYFHTMEKIECPVCGHSAGAYRVSTVEGVLEAAQDLAKLPMFQVDKGVKLT